MFAEEDNAADAAIGFTDQFVDAGAAKLDALFGTGFAKANPQALAAYIAACASNLNAFMTAAAAMEEEFALDEALTKFDQDHARKPAPGPKGRQR